MHFAKRLKSKTKLNRSETNYQKSSVVAVTVCLAQPEEADRLAVPLPDIRRLTARSPNGKCLRLDVRRLPLRLEQDGRKQKPPVRLPFNPHNPKRIPKGPF
jgi:hypothetical protein